MELNIKLFGKLAELTGKNDMIIQASEGMTLQELEKMFCEKYDTWSLQTYLIAVNQSISDNHKLSAGDEVAFLPPFAGG